MGMPIHVVEQDILHMEIHNKLQSTGLSIHFHGFEMAKAIEYDGVVGLTQCAVPPGDKFGYNFRVEEIAGSYWYHTHSGNLGIESHNMIKAPLIVHKNTPESKSLVDDLNSIVRAGLTGRNVDYRPLLSYENERILFFSDGFLKSDTMNLMYYIGGLNPPVQMNDDGFVAASIEYTFGTTNGKMREIVHVVRGQTYKLRLINGGSHFAYRVSIDGFSMTVVAADSSPVAPYRVDEVIMHNAERFDVEIKIPDDLVPGDTFWIRADTLESRNHGYQNGVRAILYVVDNIDETNALYDEDIMDPTGDIAKAPIPAEERISMNCYSNMEIEFAFKNKEGACLPITALEPLHRREEGCSEKQSSIPANHGDDGTSPTPAGAEQNVDFEYYLAPPPPLKPSHIVDDDQEGCDEQSPIAASSNHGDGTPAASIRTVDFDFNNPPLHAHFTRIDNGNWYQHTFSHKTNMLRPDFDPERDLHPNAAIMNVPAHSPVIIIWRSKSIMDQ